MNDLVSEYQQYQVCKIHLLDYVVLNTQVDDAFSFYHLLISRAPWSSRAHIDIAMQFNMSNQPLYIIGAIWRLK